MPTLISAPNSKRKLKNYLDKKLQNILINDTSAWTLSEGRAIDEGMNELRRQIGSH